jgi:hypothetical protein
MNFTQILTYVGLFLVLIVTRNSFPLSRNRISGLTARFDCARRSP